MKKSITLVAMISLGMMLSACGSKTTQESEIVAKKCCEKIYTPLSQDIDKKQNILKYGNFSLSEKKMSSLQACVNDELNKEIESGTLYISMDKLYEKCSVACSECESDKTTQSTKK